MWSQQPRKMNLLCEGRHKSCQVILKADNANYLKMTMPARFDCTKLLPASPFSSAKRNCFKMELEVDPRKDDDASPTPSERMKVELFTKNYSRNTQVSIFFEIKFNFLVFCVVYSTCENLSIHVSITIVWLILTKLSSFSTWVLDLLWKENQFYLVSVRWYLCRPFHLCINYYCRTDKDETRVF